MSKTRTGISLPLKPSALAGFLFAMMLTACSSVMSQLPTQLGGEPAGVPERPASPDAYPAVHDMPPARPNTVLTDAEQKKAQAELAAARADQAKRAEQAAKDQ